MKITIKDRVHGFLLGKDWVASGNIEKQCDLWKTKPSTIDRILRFMVIDGTIERRHLDKNHTQYRKKCDYAPIEPKDERSIYDVAREMRLAKEEIELKGQCRLFS